MRRRGLVLGLLLLTAPSAGAQLVPNDRWLTFETSHFRIHFTAPLEEQARRAAANAELAYAQMSRELVPPRGMIELVVADNLDFVNGYATPFPSNRIVVFAHPPTDASGLRNYRDWNALVVTHELAHVFHLDRARGIWGLGQKIFGRNPLLFPNAYAPAWVIEGLAVYYESRLTGGGRLESSEHFMTARAAALDGRVPRLHELSPGTSRFPGGQVVYVYGSLLFDYLAQTRGDSSIRDFVERSSRTPLPFFLTPVSRSAFGMSFQTAWERWTAALSRDLGPAAAPMAGWRELTRTGRVAAFPRWLSDTTLIYAGSKGREVSASYVVGADGKERRLGRRNGTSPNTRLPDGSIVFAQPDYLDLYHIRTDLYVEKNGSQSRLTRGARLSSPDVHGAGEIVAVQDVPGSTRLVRLSLRAPRVTPLTVQSLDVQWSDPRWSPDGTHIVAVRQTSGSSELVVLDANGKIRSVFGAQEAINSSPSWSHDGRQIFFSSERTGSSQVYVADAPHGNEAGEAAFAGVSRPAIRRLSSASTGLFSPEQSPNGAELAAVLFRGDGYHIGVAPARQAETAAVPSRISPRASCTNCVTSAGADTASAWTGSARRYSPWRTLLPTYWLPVIESSEEDGTGFGAATSGNDVIGRHTYVAEALFNTKYSEQSALLWYRYAGLGLPLLDLYTAQTYSHEGVFSGDEVSSKRVGSLSERSRIASLQAVFLRPRFRTNFAASLGGEVESESYSTDPDTLLPRLPKFFQKEKTYPGIVGAMSFANTRRPALSISPEDGFAAGVTARQRWQSGTSGTATRSVVGITSAFKSLDLPGFAHHVFALRGAIGVADERATTRFSAGGISGTSLEVLPGYAVGEQRRAFGVRGYPAGAEGGIRAYAATAEYRLPLTAPSRGFRYLPLFIDKTSLTLFHELGRAYCPADALKSGGICRARDVNTPTMSSAGAELNIDTGVALDLQARIRFGVAFPLRAREELRASSARFYGTFGTSF